MKYNKITKTEKPENECPNTCGECPYFIKHRFGGTCTANGCKTPTSDYIRPYDRPLPQPLNCYWWYMNRVLNNASAEKQSAYAEERLHLLTAWRYVEGLTTEERYEFSKHLYRDGGGRLIDFSLYPRAWEIYNEIRKELL